MSISDVQRRSFLAHEVDVFLCFNCQDKCVFISLRYGSESIVIIRSLRVLRSLIDDRIGIEEVKERLTDPMPDRIDAKVDHLINELLSMVFLASEDCLPCVIYDLSLLLNK